MPQKVPFVPRKVPNEKFIFIFSANFEIFLYFHSPMPKGENRVAVVPKVPVTSAKCAMARREVIFSL